MQYREELSVNIIAWICAFIPNIAILFSGYLRGILIDNFNIFFLFSIAVSIVPSYFILRMIWNKRCKKEWLPDEALAFVAHGLGLALILSILFCTIYIPIMMIQFELHLKYVLLFYGFIFGSFIFCKVLLKLTARKPYKGSSFCFQ